MILLIEIRNWVLFPEIMKEKIFEPFTAYIGNNQTKKVLVSDLHLPGHMSCTKGNYL